MPQTKANYLVMQSKEALAAKEVAPLLSVHNATQDPVLSPQKAAEEAETAAAVPRAKISRTSSGGKRGNLAKVAFKVVLGLRTVLSHS